MDYIKLTFNRLDILVNNAGIYLDYLKPALNIDANTILRAFETDVCGTFSMSQAAIPLMKENNYGRIVNLSSTSSLIANMNDDTGLAYKICKTAINAITVVLSNAVAVDNILINAVTPGWVKTYMGGEMAPLSLEEGADTPVWLATLPDNGPSGGLFSKRERLPW
jgi:NAD(P)-dependent dehydrogenase (short-subunit alcohol dehydrogenase family)